MTFLPLTQALRGYWQRRLVRVAVAALVLLAAIYVEYRLAHIPLPVEIEKDKSTFTPAHAPSALARELVLDSPSAAEGVLLLDEGKPRVTVEAHFESARLADDIMELLRRERPPRALPSGGLEPVDYTTAGDAGAPAPTTNAPASTTNRPTQTNGEPCRTSVRVASAEGASPPGELHFFQLKAPPADQYRYFEIKAVGGGDLVVELLTRNLAGTVPDESCRKTLTVGDWRRSFSSPVPLHIVVPAGASFHFSFTPLADKAPWATQSTPYEPFELASAPLVARAVRVVTRDAAPATPPVFSATSVDAAQPLVLRQLLIGWDELQLDFAGRAMVRENGEDAVTFDLFQFASRNRLLAGILVMFDAALLEWVRRIVFK